ncbi:hypothetical protein [Octadecabacter arcticus]|jgi:hypothetical protein|uniref:hypothetical protein n=1 Tax=Octadecabacter arcticus TaxID=53946 RepID=UPI0005C4FEC7|nr:hypothetical protein [Octadecabacter arcticus]
MKPRLEMTREQLLTRLNETADETRAVATIIDSASVEKRRDDRQRGGPVRKDNQILGRKTNEIE